MFTYDRLDLSDPVYRRKASVVATIPPPALAGGVRGKEIGQIMAQHLTINIPDALPIVIEDAGQSNEEIRRSLAALYPQVSSASVARVGCAVNFSRPSGGSKGR